MTVFGMMTVMQSLGELDEIVPDDVFRDGFAAMAVPVEDLS